MEARRETTIYRVSTLGKAALLLCMGLLASCASSGDVEQARQESAQAKAKMSAELQQERKLAQSMEKESEARKAEADKLAKALGGKQSQAGPKLQLAATSMTLTVALQQNTGCLAQIPAQGPNPLVQSALFIGTLPGGGNSPCTSVTVNTTDTTAFTAAQPLIPVVVGSGGTLTLNDPGAGSTMTLYASSFLIQNTGTMSAGSVSTPVAGRIMIAMAGNSSAALPPTTGDQNPNMRDITVMDGGVLALYGGKGLSATPNGTQNNPASNPAFINTVYGTKSWTYLAASAGPSTYNDAENVSAPVPAANPATTLTLATAVDWKKNDWISVATTSFSSHQTEIVQICNITTVSNPDPGYSPYPAISGVPQYTIPKVPTNVSQITLCSSTPLKHYHYGGLAPTPGFFPANTTQKVVTGGNPINVSYQARSFYDGSSRNYGIDERAEVALLSRNIKLTSVAGQSTDANNFIGGHLVAMVTGTTAPTLTLAGVEIEKFGQGLVGRYPVHLHKLPSGNNVLIQDVSVHHSYNKCYVVHGTGSANFYNNVCVRTVGQGFYLEDGNNITLNQFMRNHIAGTMAANSTYSFPQQNGSQYWDGDNVQGYYYSTTGQPWYQNANWYNVNNVPDTSQSGQNTANPVDSTTPGGFWITNLANTFVNNSVAGCLAQGRGYWLLAQGSTTTGYPEFTGNRVHGCYNGIDNDDITGNTQQMIAPMLTGGANYAPVLLLTDDTATRSRNAGVWLRSVYATLHNSRFATNPHGVTVLVGGGPEGTYPGFWGLVHQSVFAGMTRNNADRYPTCAQGSGSWTSECTDVALQSTFGGWGAISIKINIVGYSYYDGPARIEHNRFVNFRFDPTGMHPTDPAARLLTQTDITNIKTYIPLGQLEAPPSLCAPTCQTTTLFNGYVGDAATAWQQSNAQSVPPTQYIRDSIWDNVDFKHQVYTDDVNLGPLNDGDKTTVIRDLDGQLSGLRVVNANRQPEPDLVPISLNNLEYYATGFTVDEPHSRGPNNFRASSLMSPHKYATLNVESVNNPSGNWPKGFPLEIKRDMPNPDNTTYPNLYFYGRGQQPIYEPFVMDRMGYTLYSKTGIEHASPTGAAFQPQLLFSYTDPPVHQGGDFFISRIAVYQPLQNPTQWKSINVSRIRRQWGGQNYGSQFPPNFNPPGAQGASCDNVFNQNQGAAQTKWQDCLARAQNQSPYNAAPYINPGYPYGIALQPAADWTSFEQSYKKLLAGQTSVQNFITNQTYYYDTTNSLLYFYMIEDQPVQWLPAPYGTCGGGGAQYAANVTTTQAIKSFSDKNSVKAALDASCLAGGGTWQPSPTQPASITNVSLNTPIVITSQTVPFPGAKVTITGTSTPADGTWSVTVLNNTTFSLNNSQGSGTYTSGGTWSPLYPIANASNASPIVVTTTSPVPANGTQVVISGVQGNTAANNTWTVASANPAAGTFALQGSTGNGAFVKYDPQPIDLFICGQIGCAAYLVDFGTNVATTFTPCTAPCAPPHPIKWSDYNKLNQYQLVYGTSIQQPNGLPVAANSAIGNTPPPTDGAPLIGVMAPIDNMPPSTGSGDQVNYLFMGLSGTTQITQNFPYSCATTIPWSPVNARGSYPPSGGFASPLHDSVCDWVMPNPIVNVTGNGGTTTITSTSANTTNPLILPAARAQVVLSGVAGLSNGPYAVSNPTANSFSISATYSGSYTGGGTWQVLNPLASVANTTTSITLTVPAGAPVPGIGAVVSLSGITGCTLPAGSMPVATLTPSTVSSGGSFTLNGSVTGTCTSNNGTWQWQPQ